MARIRTIKPEFPEDEVIGQCSRNARLLFILIWTRCDDFGRFRASPTLLRSQLFPYDEDLTPQDIAAWLAELSAVGKVHLYEVDEQAYGEVTSWSKHQRIDNAGKPICPPPAGTRELRRLAESRRGSPLDPDLDLDLDQDPDLDRRTPRNLEPVWALVADVQARTAKGVQDQKAWKRKVAANARRDLGPDAERLVATYPDISDTQLADALCGNTNVLRTLRRSS